MNEANTGSTGVDLPEASPRESPVAGIALEEFAIASGHQCYQFNPGFN
jgi:hypothetical protein